jgi:multisubunit Na+/H+ antiporter MnhG subunit
MVTVKIILYNSLLKYSIHICFILLYIFLTFPVMWVLIARQQLDKRLLA